MRRIAVAVMVLLLGACGGQPGGAGDLPGPLPEGVTFQRGTSGLAAPNFSADLLDGTAITAAQMWEDRPVVLVFTATWCDRCKEVHREVADVVARHNGAVALLGVLADDDRAAAADYADELRLRHAIAVTDDRPWLDYAADEPPLVALVAPGGTILRGWPGGVNAATLATHLDGLYAEATP